MNLSTPSDNDARDSSQAVVVGRFDAVECPASIERIHGADAVGHMRFRKKTSRYREMRNQATDRSIHRRTPKSDDVRKADEIDVPIFPRWQNDWEDEVQAISCIKMVRDSVSSIFDDAVSEFNVSCRDGEIEEAAKDLVSKRREILGLAKPVDRMRSDLVVLQRILVSARWLRPVGGRYQLFGEGGRNIRREEIADFGNADLVQFSPYVGGDIEVHVN